MGTPGHNGATVAVRTPSGVSWLAADPHRTDAITIDALRPPPELVVIVVLGW